MFHASPRARCRQYAASCGTHGKAAASSPPTDEEHTLATANNCVGLDTSNHMIGNT